MHDDIPPAEAAEFSRAFDLYLRLDEARATAARLRTAGERTTGLEREANVRQAAEAEAEMARIEAELRGEGHQSEAAAPERAPAKAQRTVSARVQGSDGALRDALNDWTVQARAFADEIDDSDAKAGAHDGLRGIADRVAKRLRERGINGPRGPLSGATILREALQGGRWKRKQRIR